MGIAAGLLISPAALLFIDSRFTQDIAIVNPDANSSGGWHSTYDYEYDAGKLGPGGKSVFARQHTIIGGWRGRWLRMRVPQTYAMQPLFEKRFALGHRPIGVKGDTGPRSTCGHQHRRNFNENRILHQISHEELTYGFLACVRMLNVVEQRLNRWLAETERPCGAGQSVRNRMQLHSRPNTFDSFRVVAALSAMPELTGTIARMLTGTGNALK